MAKKIVVILLIIVSFSEVTLSEELEIGSNNIYFISLEGCENCREAEIFLNKFTEDYSNISVVKLDIQDKKSRNLIKELVKEHELTRIIAPTIIIENKHWVGFNKDIEEDIFNFLVSKKSNQLYSDRTSLNYPHYWLNYIENEHGSMFLMTGIIGTIDGFNPCSLWAITLLLSFTLRLHSRKKIILVGLTFILVIAIFYGLFILSIIKVIDYIDYYGISNYLLNGVIILIGAINIKDYFLFKKGISLTISKSGSTNLRQKFRRLIEIKNIWVLVIFTIFVAGLASILELPCTAGFPIFWSNLITQKGITGLYFYCLLCMYLFMYVLIEIIVFCIITITLSIKTISKETGKKLKLISGLIMVFFGSGSIISKNNISGFNSILIIVLAVIFFYFIIFTYNSYLKNKA
ncbi:MAG: hypothetical protein ACOCRK_08615 [bacterium]